MSDFSETEITAELSHPAVRAAYIMVRSMGFPPEDSKAAVLSAEIDSDTNEQDVLDAALVYLEEDFSSSSSEGSMPPHKVVVLIREDLGMSAGKASAQTGHAIHALCRESVPSAALREWEDGESGSAIVCLAVKDLAELQSLRAKAESVGIPSFEVRDGGRTEVQPDTLTVLALGPATHDQLSPITGRRRLYK